MIEMRDYEFKFHFVTVLVKMLAMLMELVKAMMLVKMLAMLMD
jgi:hypothetical protein